MSRKIIETKENQPIVQISRCMTIDELEQLIEGQLVYDEQGMSAILLDIVIKAYRTEKHVYIKLSSNPKTILIIK
jgi:hypothetical protein